jgi:integrase
MARMYEAITGPRKKGSENTFNSYQLGVYYLARYMRVENPEQMLEAFKAPGTFAKTVDAFIDDRLKTVSSKSLHGWLAGVKKWALINEVDMTGYGAVIQPKQETVESDRAPTREELQRILNASSPRNRVMVSLLASSGLRVGAMISLRWREIDFSLPDICKITVEKGAGRKFTGNAKLFVTFCTPETRELLLSHKKTQEAAGISTEPDSLVFTSRARGPVDDRVFRLEFLKVVKVLGIGAKGRKFYEVHCHSLRKWWRTQVESAGINRSFWDKWMGHAGGYLDASYFRPIEEAHATEYRKAIPSLSIYGATDRKVDNLEARLEEAKRMYDEQDRIIKQLQDRVMVVGPHAGYTAHGTEGGPKLRVLQERNAKNKIVTEAESEELILAGWEFQAVLPSGKIVLKRG